MFRSGQSRLLIGMFVFGLLFDLAAVWAFFVVSGSEVTFADVGIGFVILEAVQIGLGLKNSIATWSWFLVWGRRAYADTIVVVLRTEGFPVPVRVYGSATDYLASVADDESAALELRLKAATLVGMLAYPGGHSRPLEGVRVAMAYERAIANLR